MPQQYLSPAQVAELTGLPVRSIRRYIANGELRATRVGRLLRVSLAEVQVKFGPVAS